jgi:hypothetical protein
MGYYGTSFYGTTVYGATAAPDTTRLPTGHRVPTGLRLPGGVDVSPARGTFRTFTVGQTVTAFAVDAGSQQTVTVGSRKTTLAAGRRVLVTMTAETD